MAKSMSHQHAAFSITGVLSRKARHGAVLLLGMALIAVSPQGVYGQSNQQQEQQQRDQQQRDQQQREQQEREQQQRDQQQRDQQQRDQQQREQQERDQQQRDQQQREQQQREQQQREQQERDQQQRDQQQREQQQRAQQQQEHASSDSAAPSSNASSAASRPTAQPPVSDVKRATSDTQTPGVEGKLKPSAPVVNATAAKDHESSPSEPDLRRKICENGPCKEPEPRPVEPDPRRKICKDGPCQQCPPGQSAGKDGSCAPPPSAKATAPQSCPSGQVWSGNQCVMGVMTGAQQCQPGQTRIGSSCQTTDCATPTASAQNVIARLRNARQRRDDDCRQNSTMQDCQEATAQYNSVFSEYQAFLAGVPAECRIGLLDPNAI